MKIAHVARIHLQNVPYVSNLRDGDAVVLCHAGGPRQDFLRIVAIPEVQTPAPRIAEFRQHCLTDLALDVYVPALIIRSLVFVAMPENPRIRLNQIGRCQGLYGRRIRERLRKSRDGCAE